MNIDKYNNTFYNGIAILTSLIIVAFLTYLFKYDNIKYAINILILFVILLLTILCSSTFKNNVIEDFITNATAENAPSIVNTLSALDNSGVAVNDIAIPMADEPFGRVSKSLFGDTNLESPDAKKDRFKFLYDAGYRGFHFYVQYPTRSSTPTCVFPYKDNNGMDRFATRSTTFDLEDVLGALDNAASGFSDPVFLSLTCLSRDAENTERGILTLLTNNTYVRIRKSKPTTLNSLIVGKKIVPTIGTYDNIRLNNFGDDFLNHYYIKENDLKYASFNTIDGFGVYAPLINYTKQEQDLFNARGYDEKIQDSVNLAYLNGVQFVCIPPTIDKGSIQINNNVTNYDYPKTITRCRSEFSNPEGNINAYQKRRATAFTHIGKKVDRIDNSFNQLDGSFNELEAALVPLLANLDYQKFREAYEEYTLP